MSSRSEDKPIPIQKDLRHLPSALEPLTQRPNWVLWRFEKAKDKEGKEVKDENGNVKWTKVPYRPNGNKARTTDDSTWSTYGSVIKALYSTYDDEEGFDGIGICLDNDLAAFDVDDCRDPNTGIIKPWALRLVEDAKSYTEVTVSGTGLRIIGFGEGEYIHRRQKAPDGVSLETYRKPNGRYIVVTGNPLAESASKLVNIDVQIDAKVAELDALDRAQSRSQRSASGSSTSKPIPRGLAVKLNLVTVEPYQSRSELLFAFIIEALRAGVADETIVEACVDDAHQGAAIFEHCQENGGETYVQTQIERAKDKIGEGLETGVAEINDQHTHWSWQATRPSS